MRSAEVKRLREVFAKLIANLIELRRPIIYADETTYNTWQRKAKSWSTRESPNIHARNNKRRSVTVYGAIGSCLAYPVFTLGGTTNGIEFRRFIIDVKDAFRSNHNGVKPIFLYDAAKAHTAYASQELLSQYFEPLQIPTYSCEFNCKVS